MCIDIHTVAVRQAEEAYENLAMSFQSVFGEIYYMVILTIDEQCYTVIFYFCCDNKVCNIQCALCIHTMKSVTNMITFCYS